MKLPEGKLRRQEGRMERRLCAVLFLSVARRAGGISTASLYLPDTAPCVLIYCFPDVQCVCVCLRQRTLLVVCPSHRVCVLSVGVME